MSQEPANPHLIRLGYHDRANLMPLLHPLKTGWVAPDSPWSVEVVNMPPAALVTELAAGRLDVASVPPLSMAGHSAKLTPLGGWGLACEAATETALLLAPQRLDSMDGGTVAVSPEAEGSTAEHLLRILLKPYYDIDLTLQPADAATPGDAKDWARLLYSDSAPNEAERRPEGAIAEDLGVAWYVLSGQPLIWEMVAVTRDLEARKPGASEAIQVSLQRSQRVAQEQQSSILDEAALRLGLKREKVKELFGRQKYRLGEREQKGLAQFYTLASQAGLMSRD